MVSPVRPAGITHSGEGLSFPFEGRNAAKPPVSVKSSPFKASPRGIVEVDDPESRRRC